MPRIARRNLIGGGLASALLAACGGGTPEPEAARPEPEPPTVVERMTDLVLASGLSWMVVARPREIAATPFLIPAIAELVPEENFDAFQRATALDLRQIKEAVVASIEVDGSAPEEPRQAMLYLVRHAGDPKKVERKFRERITADAKRSADRNDVVRASGIAGTRQLAFAAIGRDVVAYQEGGDPSSGPARIAALVAEKKLKKSPAALSREPLRALYERFGDAPLIALAKGPFDGEWKDAAGGLLAISEAAGLAVRPSARDKIWLHLALVGGFGSQAAGASERLAMSWDALAQSSFGHLLGLHEPVQAPLPTHTERVVALAVELDPLKLARGLAAATQDDIRSIMRW